MNNLLPPTRVKCTESDHWPVCLLELSWDTWEEAGAGVGGQSEGQQENIKYTPAQRDSGHVYCVSSD